MDSERVDICFKTSRLYSRYLITCSHSTRSPSPDSPLYIHHLAQRIDTHQRSMCRLSLPRTQHHVVFPEHPPFLAKTGRDRKFRSGNIALPWHMLLSSHNQNIRFPASSTTSYSRISQLVSSRAKVSIVPWVALSTFKRTPSIFAV